MNKAWNLPLLLIAQQGNKNGVNSYMINGPSNVSWYLEIQYHNNINIYIDDYIVPYRVPLILAKSCCHLHFTEEQTKAQTTCPCLVNNRIWMCILAG